MDAAFRAIFGYCFLVFMVRVVGKRPGKHLTPFEFVLIFFMGGVTLTPMVGDDRSLTNALCTIATIAVTHFVLSWLKQVSPAIGRVIDGMPLVLLEKGQWRTEAMTNMRMQDSEVMATARNEGKDAGRYRIRDSRTEWRNQHYSGERELVVSCHTHHPPTQPVTDSVTKVNDEIAVGSDLRFQHRWWRFERTMWVVFVIIVVLDALGTFGRGWAANAQEKTHDGTMDVKYERIERFRPPHFENSVRTECNPQRQSAGLGK